MSRTRNFATDGARYVEQPEYKQKYSSSLSVRVETSTTEESSASLFGANQVRINDNPVGVRLHLDAFAKVSSVMAIEQPDDAERQVLVASGKTGESYSWLSRLLQNEDVKLRLSSDRF